LHGEKIKKSGGEKPKDLSNNKRGGRGKRDQCAWYLWGLQERETTGSIKTRKRKNKR